MRWLTNWSTPFGYDTQDYLRDKIIGRPRGSSAYAVEELEAMGIKGIYAPDEEAR